MIPSADTMLRMVDNQADYRDYFSLLKSLAPGIADMFGPNCEVVIHDFSKEDGGSIVAISGHVTDRHVGGSMSKIGLQIRAFGDEAEDSYVYVTRLPDGRIVRSSTMVLRAQGHVFGALCINYDITEIDAAVTALSHLHTVPVADTGAAEPVSFVDDVGQVLHEMITDELRAMRLNNQRLRKSERLQLLGALKRKGAFTLQRAVPQVAEHLGVSRATVYTDLQDLRGHEQAQTTTKPTERSGHGHEPTGNSLVDRGGAAEEAGR